MINRRIYNREAYDEAIIRMITLLNKWREYTGEDSHPIPYSDNDSECYNKVITHYIINPFKLFYYIEKYISTKKSKWLTKYLKYINNKSCIIGFNNIIFTDKPNRKLSKLITRKRGVI